MTKDEMKKVVCQAIDEAAEKIHETVLRIESEPELGYKEMKTAAKVESYMKELGAYAADGTCSHRCEDLRRWREERPCRSRSCGTGRGGNTGQSESGSSHGAAHTCGHFLQMASMLAACTGIVRSGGDEGSGGERCVFCRTGGRICGN